MRSHNRRVSRSSLAAIAALALFASPAAAGELGPGHSPMSYVGSFFATSLYFPAKLAFAVGGAVASGVTYIATLGNRDQTEKIWDASVEGDYVVTPNMIEGNEDVDFVGG